MYDGLGKTVESGTVVGLAWFVATRIAVTHADQLTWTGERERYYISGDRHDTTVHVKNLDLNHGEIGVVRGEYGTVGGQTNGRGCTSGLSHVLDRLPLAHTFGHKLAGDLFYLPLQVLEVFYGSLSQRSSV